MSGRPTTGSAKGSENRHIHWGGNYAADHVAEFMVDHNKDVKKVFEYLDLKDDIGFECHVNGEEALAWIKRNKSELYDKCKE